ncbi:hypothetical protein [Sinomonas flava]|uniref:hypothetical protein n=1 Tax=Sinomonas flava TaxID=496857 RepID=UPI0039A4FFAD
MLLLQKRYAANNPHNLQLVPDRHKGDLGIEAYSHDGIAYQCYAAEEPLSVNERYEKQRNKLTTDLGKLRKNREELIRLLGRTILHHYVFMVHKHDSRLLISHATEKATEVAAWGLPFLAPSLIIVIETDEDYAVEREAIHALPAPLVAPKVITAEDTKSWQEGNPSLRSTAAEKLGRVNASESTIETVLQALTSQYLQGENALERLRTISPEVHRGVLAAKAQREDLLVLEYPPSKTDTQKKLAVIAKEFALSLRNDYRVLNEQTAQTLAWSAVADWLMRCPLDFEGAR